MPWQDSWHPHFIRHSQSPQQGLRAHPMATLTAQAAGIFVRVVAGNGHVSSTRKPMINWLIYMLNDFVGPVLISPKFCCSLCMLYGGCGQGYMYTFSFILFNGRIERAWHHQESGPGLSTKSQEGWMSFLESYVGTPPDTDSLPPPSSTRQGQYGAIYVGSKRAASEWVTDVHARRGACWCSLGV